MTKNPAARQMLGYLFVRGGVHAHAYAMALEKLTGVEMKEMLPIPKIENEELPEMQAVRGRGLHRKLYRFSPDDYKEMAAIWQGQALDGSGPLEVIDGPPEGGELARLDGTAEAFTPGVPSGGDLRDGTEAVSQGELASTASPSSHLVRPGDALRASIVWRGAPAQRRREMALRRPAPPVAPPVGVAARTRSEHDRLLRRVLA